MKRFDETLAGFPAEIKDEKWKSVMYYKSLTLGPKRAASTMP